MSLRGLFIPVSMLTIIRKSIRSLVKTFRKKENLFLLIYFVSLFCVLLINTFHESYPDEFDNILGGKYLVQGIPIYTGFFTHHGPFAYFLAAFITLFTGNSFVWFRIVFALLLFGYLLWTFLYVRRRFGSENTRFYLVTLALTAIAGNYYWLHMFLADSLSAYFLGPVILILLLATVTKQQLTKKDLLIASLLTSFSVLSSLTYIYLSILLYGYSFYLFLKHCPRQHWLKQAATAVGIFSIPYGVFLIYLLITASLKEYFFQAWNFNQHYYVYNYPRPEGTTSINPLRFAIVIANAFYNSYFALLQQVKDLNIGFPLNITLAVGTFCGIAYVFFKRYYLLGLFLIGTLIYANARSNPLTSKETDYQSAVYIMIGFILIPYLLTRLLRELKLHKELVEKVGMILVLLLVGFYSLFSAMFLFQKFFNRTYDKYMGTAALIYDRPEIAPLLNRIVTKDETIWIGPFEFAELFYSNNKPASKYQIFIPGMGASPEIRDSYVSEIEKTKPPVIYFQRNFFILGRSPEMYGQFFIDYLNKNYILLTEYEKNGVVYSSTIPVTEKVDLEGRLYIRRDRADEMIQRLLREGMIHEKTES